ncbi:MAG: AsnC family transcriptional regulator [Promethearchaeota archaeon]
MTLALVPTAEEIAAEIEEIKSLLGTKELAITIDPADFADLDKEARLSSIFQHFLPEMLPSQICQDLTYLFLYKILSGKEKTEILNEWCRKTNSSPTDQSKITIQFEDGTTYCSVFDLLWYDNITDGSFLPNMVERVAKFDMYKYPLSVQETVQYMDLLALSTQRMFLDRTDVDLLSAMDQNPLISIKKLAKQLKLSRNTVAAHLRRLHRRCYLTVNARINYGKLGLVNLILITRQKLPLLPYMKIIQELRAGTILNTYSFSLPGGAVDSLSSLLRKYGIEGELWEVANQRESFAIKSNYDFERKEWNIGWENWALWVRRVLREGLYSVYVTGDMGSTDEHSEKASLIDFDLTDLKLLNLLTLNASNPIRQLSNELGLSISQTYERRERLKREAVFSPYIHLVNVGLDETVFLQCTGDMHFLKTIESCVLELPRVYVYHLRDLRGNNSLAAFCSLPKGSLTNLDYILREYIENLKEVTDLRLCYRTRQNFVHSAIPLKDPQGKQLYSGRSKDWVWSVKMFKDAFDSFEDEA